MNNVQPITTLADLQPDDKNANRGTERGQAMIERSLRECGAGRSILIDCNGKIIAGNKTVENAGMIGMEEIQVVKSDGTKIIAVQRTDLDLDSATDPRAREMALLDNRTGEVNLEWDTAVLDDYEASGVGLDQMFTEAERDALRLASDTSINFAPVTENEQGKLDRFATITCPECGHEFTRAK